MTLGPILLRAVGQFAYSPPPWFKGVLHQLEPLIRVVRNDCEHHHTQFVAFPLLLTLCFLMS